jgi:preprotein translocase subunit SecD
MLPVIPALAATVTALTTAFSIPLAVPQPPAPPVTATIEFRQAQAEPGPGLTRVEKDGRTFYLQPDVVVSTADIASAEQGFDPLWGQPTVSLVLNDAGRDRLAAFTETHVGKTLAITVDGALLTAPVIREPIMGGALQISGVESLAEAMDLARRLGRPPMPATRSLAEALGAHLP